MIEFTIIAILLILWGLATAAVAIFKPPKIWGNAKIQGFVQLFTETGTVIFFIIISLIAIGFGIWILL
jgi:hypothetical protein